MFFVLKKILQLELADSGWGVCGWLTTCFLQLNNDAVNIINISMGSILAVLMQQIVLQNLHTWIHEDIGSQISAYHVLFMPCDEIGYVHLTPMIDPF